MVDYEAILKCSLEQAAILLVTVSVVTYVIIVIARTSQSMDTNKVAKRDGKARRAFNVSERHTFIHAEYDIVLDGAQIGPTGLLIIARLKRKNATIGKLPEFVLRWDEKDKHLDVDPVDVSKDVKKQFKKGTSRDYGHRPIKLRSDPRVFEANIGWHGQPIYHGEIKFNLAREAEARVALGLSTSASVSFSKENC